MTASVAGVWRKLGAAAICVAALSTFAVRAAWADFSSVPLTNAAPSGNGAFVGGPRGAVVAGAQRPHPAVVRVIVPMRDSATSYGSGTLLDASDTQGLVITNWHVVEEQAGPITVVFPDGFRSHATIVKADKTWDLAALSIWKPNVAPVAIATVKPQKGDILSIAGYGSGNYRMATGRCTQYVSPGDKQPFEMVELSAAARQGDSGGPILNQRGELAGVLFGEGGGKTAGSYCGRVAEFLAGARLDDGGIAARNRAAADAASPLLGAPPVARDTRLDGWRAEDGAVAQTPARSAGFGGTDNQPADPMAGRMPAGATTGTNGAASPAGAGGFAVPGAAPTGTNPGGWGWNAGANPAGAGNSAAMGGANPGYAAGTGPNDAGNAWGRPNGNVSIPPGNWPTGPQNSGAGAPIAGAPMIGAGNTPVAAAPADGDRLAILGATRFEQGKSIFAIIGILSVVMMFTRTMSRKS